MTRNELRRQRDTLKRYADIIETVQKAAARHATHGPVMADLALNDVFELRNAHADVRKVYLSIDGALNERTMVLTTLSYECNRFGSGRHHAKRKKK